ncbi:MAG: TPM domain-containing protein [Bacteroidia bacterium]
MSFFKWEPLSEEEERKVLQSIAEAELNTSGEIRIHIDKWCKTDPVFKANNVFSHLKMEKTEARNGVLLYVALKEKKFAIVGDKGIDAVVPRDFWESTASIMRKNFSAGTVVEGICKGVQEVGVQMKKYFPYESGDINELPDEISYG